MSAAVFKELRRRILHAPPCPLADPDEPQATIVHHPPFPAAPPAGENIETLTVGAHRARTAKAIRATLDGGLDG